MDGKIRKDGKMEELNNGSLENLAKCPHFRYLHLCLRFSYHFLQNITKMQKTKNEYTVEK
jgi:hypothetical protein